MPRVLLIIVDEVLYLVRLFGHIRQLGASSLASLSVPNGSAGESSVQGSIGVLISKNGCGIGTLVRRRLSEICPIPSSPTCAESISVTSLESNNRRAWE